MLVSLLSCQLDPFNIALLAATKPTVTQRILLSPETKTVIYTVNLPTAHQNISPY
jgi:hypothetical protein